MKVIIKKSIIIMLIFSSFIQNYVAQYKKDSIDSNYNTYRQEIKNLFEKHYKRKFELDSSMNSACIDHVERLIDGKPSNTYKSCNFFVTRRFKKSAYESNQYVSLKDILFADFKLEFVEDNLNDPRFYFVNADKIHVEIGNYEDYVYVVVGVTSSWYEKNPDLWVFENDNNK
jgi:hypothetical protein